MKKPFLHACAAALYIIVIVLVISAVASGVKDETIIIPMTMLGLFVVSVAVMGFLFVSEPLRLFIENKKHDAIAFFGKTLGFFAGFVVLFVIVLLLNAHYPFITKKFGPNEAPTPSASQGKLDINVVCQSALTYMTFPDAKSADAFVAECKAGSHPEVIERYKADHGYGDGVAI